MQNCGCKGTDFFVISVIYRQLFCIFALIFNELQHRNAFSMNKKFASIGILLILSGVITLATAYFLHHTTNGLLTTGLLLIVGGIVLYVGGIKHGGRY